ncbi:hypothetical protein MANES_07G053422v8 [Manihot esculenta]|uniref:Disease resistance protein At4g27190-like leucine-rich repeats domain-containing protein n=1 Tax=Manihot esculenta TaxID=3983 RepID=A0A2C9VKA4_MANES|nr:hypothetical protein MANES_07G053422v8 [Manihot esculenta]
MGKEAKKQNKLVKIVSALIKVVRKTTDLCATCVEDCPGSDAAVFCPVPQMSLPWSFRVSSSSMRNDHEEVSLKLLRSVSERRRPISEEVESNIHAQKLVKERKCSNNGIGRKRYVGKLGTIDEEEPLIF